jgi:hypothetical protein
MKKTTKETVWRTPSRCQPGSEQPNGSHLKKMTKKAVRGPLTHLGLKKRMKMRKNMTKGSVGDCSSRHPSGYGPGGHGCTEDLIGALGYPGGSHSDGGCPQGNLTVLGRPRKCSRQSWLL